MKTPARRRVGLLLASFCLPLFAQAAETQPTHEFSLDNGLKVIVREDHRAPVVVSQLWYRIGSSYETPGLTGLSHALEHMMFKGSRKLGPGEASRVLRDLGAEENAFTTDDYTAYYQVLARDRLPVALEMEADRMAHLSLPADQFKSEIEVIKEERRLRTDDNPNALAFERFKAAAYPASGYHTDHRLDGRPAAHDHRRPAPLVRILVRAEQRHPGSGRRRHRRRGQDPRQALLRRDPLAPAPPARKPLELAEPGERRLKLYVRTQLPNLIMGFNVPSLGSSENPREVNALRLIGALLDGGYSARLASRLERGEELVAGASTYYDAFNRGDSLFVLSATPNVQKGKTLEQVEAGLWKQLDDLKQNPPSAAEIERVRAQMIAGMVYEKDSIAAQASSIGQLESVGLSWKLIDQDLEALKAVTPDDIQKAARTYFTPSRLTLAQVLPVKAEEKEARHE